MWQVSSHLNMPVAQGLWVFRENEWISSISCGQTMIIVLVRQPEVRHKIHVQDFERRLKP
jgi:hypothetical protein